MKSIHRSILARSLMAGASLLAIVLGSGDANAVVFGGPGGDGYIIPSTGYYDFRVAGAQGGPSGHVGGLGAIVGGELFFDAGDTLRLIVGGGGYVGIPIEGYAGSGGGGSFVFGGSGLLFAAGGGAGDNFGSALGNPGIGTGPHPGGFGSSGSYGGGGGGGVPTVRGPLGNLPPPQQPAQAGSFPNGGAGACCYFGGGPTGGYGGGGGGGYNGGGGGGGDPGGAGSEGGYSYVIDTARNPFGITGGNGFGAFSVPSSFTEGANGYLSINFVAAPEPSTWAMTLMGFAGLGWLARLRRRKLAQG
jgi:PEP-CTERM motif